MPRNNSNSGQNRGRRNHGKEGHFGDLLKRHKSNCTRVLLQNTGGIGFVSNKRCEETLKMERLKQLVLDYDVDLVCLSEVNKDWRSVNQAHTIWNGTSGWKENRRVQISNNVSKPTTGEHQVGGTAMLAFQNLVFNISHQGSDSRKLGRWSYFSITGKNKLTTTFLTCYCPVVSSSPGSFYSQNLVYMAENKNKIPHGIACPRQLYGYDLKQLIDEKTNLGHQLIVCGDFNCDYEELCQWMHSVSLCDLLESKHGRPPITYQRSARDPLDCFFGSPSLQISKGGHLSFGRLLGDHRALWIDIPNCLIYGFNPPSPTHLNARRLKIKDPRVVDKYLTRLHEECLQEDLYSRMNHIHEKMTSPLSPTFQTQYEEIVDILVSKMQLSELKCRKLHTGSVPWSPAYKKNQLNNGLLADETHLQTRPA